MEELTSPLGGRIVLLSGSIGWVAVTIGSIHGLPGARFPDTAPMSRRSA